MRKVWERFADTYKFYSHDFNQFILLLQKRAYPYEYMDYWEKFNEASLPEKEDCFSHSNMEDITDSDHAKTVCQGFEKKHFSEYHNLYVQSDALLLVNVTEDFRDMCLEVYE